EITDQGAKMISALTSVLAVENEVDLDEKKVEELISKIVDPVGTFYRYSLASSFIKRKVSK
ncbi:MAG TPA: oxidoreductase, partial [Methanofastidiosum sp.]|nr:oxidoreductase [Methanofastidiosum sp.]